MSISLKLQHWGDVLRKSGGTKRYGWAAFFGVLATLTLPPIYLYPLLIPAFSGLLLLIVSARSYRQAFAMGWWFGLGYFTTSLYWFAHALLVEADKFAWMIPFAVLGLPSILAIYYGMAALAVWKLPVRHPIEKILGFALIWLLAEWLRGHLFSGFPWNLTGYSWSFSTVMVQFSALIGPYGLSWWTLLLAALPAVLLWPDASARAKTAALLIVLLMLLLPFGYGLLRLHGHPTEYTGTLIRLVQANIPQPHKWDPQLQMGALRKHVELSIPGDGEPYPDVVVWSESSYPFALQAKTPPIQAIMEALPAGTQLITGALRIEESPSDWKVWNSLFVVNGKAEVTAYYDKYRLVPFGEFVPLRGWIPMEKKITHGMQDFSRGAAIEPLRPAAMPPFLPLICYEAVFPELAQQNEARAEWIVNVTNDAWFGVSSGPYQHFQMARMRAVEQGLPLVRVANTGISAIIDGYGRILHSSALNEDKFLSAYLPAASQRAPYARYGDGWVLSAILLVTTLSIGFLRFYRKTD